MFGGVGGGGGVVCIEGGGCIVFYYFKEAWIKFLCLIFIKIRHLHLEALQGIPSCALWFQHSQGIAWAACGMLSVLLKDKYSLLKERFKFLVGSG